MEQSLSNITLNNHITTIRANCSNDTLLCLGGGIKNSDLILTIACGNCLQITTETALNCPVFYGGAYWYYTNLKSIGFAPTSQITMNVADTCDLNSNQRLSFHLEGSSGGYRIGSYQSNSDSTYSKYFYISYGM